MAARPASNRVRRVRTVRTVRSVPGGGRNMKAIRYVLTAVIVAGVPSAYVLAQQPAAQPQPMSFFVTSVGKGDGANLGGLAGADAHCTALAKAAGRDGGLVWHAYLSTQGAGA